MRSVVESCQLLMLACAHQREVRQRRVVLIQHSFKHGENALLYALSFLEGEVSGVEVEIQVDVFRRMVVAYEDRHGRLLVTVVQHQHPRRVLAAERDVTIEAFE